MEVTDSDNAKPEDILNTIHAIETMFRMSNDLPVPLRFHDSFIGCMAILQKVHDDLVQKAPKEVIELARKGGLLNGQSGQPANAATNGN